MWELLATELLVRLRGAAGLLTLIVTGGAGLLLLEAPTALVLNAVISALLLMPLMVNGLFAAADAREHRIHFQKLLPLRSIEIGLVRIAVPLLVQLSGVLAATLSACLAVALRTHSFGIFWRIAWIGLALLTTLQWFALQREFVTWRRLSGLPVFVAGVGALLASTTVFFAAFLSILACGSLVPLPTSLAAAAAMLLTVGIQAGATLGVFVRRDAIAA